MRIFPEASRRGKLARIIKGSLLRELHSRAVMMASKKRAIRVAGSSGGFTDRQRAILSLAKCDVDVIVVANGNAAESRDRTAVWSKAGSIGRLYRRYRLARYFFR